MPISVERRVSVPKLIAAILCGVFGFGFFVFFLITGITDLADGMYPAQMPGDVRLNLQEAGSYTIFHEYGHQFGSDVKAGGDDDMNRLELKLTGENGEEVELREPTANSTYDVNGRSGYSVYDFQLQTPGEYVLTGTYPDAANTRALMLNVAHNFGGKLLVLIGKCFAAVGLFALMGVILLYLALKKPKT